MKSARERAFFVFLLFLAGCSSSNPKTAPVTGTVMYKGQPVEGAEVTFSQVSAPRKGIGVTDAQGKYSIATFEKNDGALLGNHVVSITMSNAKAGMSADDMIKMGSKPAASNALGLPAKYANELTSPLIADVKAGKNNFDFTLED